MVNKRRDAVLLTSSTKQNKGAQFSWEPMEHVVQTSQVLSREDSRLCKGHRKHSLGNTSDLQQIQERSQTKALSFPPNRELRISCISVPCWQEQAAVPLLGQTIIYFYFFNQAKISTCLL